MSLSIGARLQHAWSAFRNKDPAIRYGDIGPGYGYRPDRVRFTRGNERSIVTSVYNRITLDASAINIYHARLDDNNRFTTPALLWKPILTRQPERFFRMP